jgi:UDP-N-acetylglucosamine acyltransferase
VIDPRAIVDPGARLGRNVVVGAWSIIGAGVEVGDDCVIASHVVVKGPTRIGARNRIFQFSSIGEDTPALAYRGEATTLEIGDDNVIREGVTMHRGIGEHGGRTIVGSGNLFMAYVHIAHDCVVGNHVIMSNNAAVSGHVTVGDYANLGGYAGVPQFRAIGAHAMVGGMSLVVKDVPAFVTVSGNPAGAIGLNVEGMRRRGFDAATMAALKDAYRVVYREGRGVRDALAALREAAAANAAVALFCESIAASRQGIVRPRREAGGG